GRRFRRLLARRRRRRADRPARRLLPSDDGLFAARRGADRAANRPPGGFFRFAPAAAGRGEAAVACARLLPAARAAAVPRRRAGGAPPRAEPLLPARRGAGRALLRRPLDARGQGAHPFRPAAGAAAARAQGARMTKRVAIVGAGIGGLALGIRLQSAGIATTIVEARDKPGGRAYHWVRDGHV